jgi:hypothetical protein
MSEIKFKDKPEYCYQSGCPLAVTGKGFAFGAGDPKNAELFLILDSPEASDTMFILSPSEGRKLYGDRTACDRELEHRKNRYPDIPLSRLMRGVPGAGRAGAELDTWVFPATGLTRDKVFVDHVIRCVPPKNKQGKHYPTGEERKQAEHYCRHYDRLDEFKPDTIIVSLGPQSLLGEITPLPLQIKDFEKARDFAALGKRVLMTLGGAATEAFARCGRNVTKLRGAYFLLKANWLEGYRGKFTFKTKAQKKKLEQAEDLFGGNVDVEKPKFKRKKKEKVEKEPKAA